MAILRITPPENTLHTHQKSWQVIPSACNACPENRYEVTSSCMGCLAHPCQSVCPKGAISMKNGKSVIDQEKCIKCGKCREICPYDAICHKERPCKAACGIGAITSDHVGRAVIDNEKCVSCGQCMVSCPFGAIADKSQIFQLIRAMQSGRKIIAQVAPAFAGQFGPKVTPEMFKTALKELGFADVYETALGADMGCMAEAEHYVKEVATGKQQFALTSCCPSWSVMAKNLFPETIDKISNELTPMVATARLIKQEHPDASVVFIGPCASKKLEASRRTVRSDVDFVITFEELVGMFDAKGIDMGEKENAHSMHDATAAGRGYAVAGGVAGAIEECLKAYYPDVTPKIIHAEGLAECKKTLALAKAGKINGCLIEGMGCPGGQLTFAANLATINKVSVREWRNGRRAGFRHQFPVSVDKIALLKRFCGNDTIIVEVQIFKGHDLYGRKYKENTKADRKCYRERKQDRNGSHLAAAAPVLFPYFVRNLFPAII